jgi:hypothetical protein
MRAVSHFEAKLLRILYTILGRSPIAQVYRWFEETNSPPPCLSRDTIELIKQALSKGATSLLAEAGGWKKERFLRNEDISDGRLWERTPPQELGMSFSPATIDFLVWLTAENTKTNSWPYQRKLTTGDKLLNYLAFRTINETGLVENWSKQSWAKKNGLIALAFPNQFAHPKLAVDPHFDEWVMGVGGCVVECFQQELARYWIDMEQKKAHITSPAHMRQLGAAQQLVLDRFLSAAKAADRTDLCRFLLDAARQLLPSSAGPQQWARALKVGKLRISERTEVYRNASIFLESLDQLEQWQQKASTVGYFDEGYAASQLWLSTWEEFNADEHVRKSRQIREDLAPF